MNNIAGGPYVEALFDKDGRLANLNEVKLNAGGTDLFVVLHGGTNAESGTG
jgi:hypothetical protein